MSSAGSSPLLAEGNATYILRVECSNNPGCSGADTVDVLVGSDPIPDPGPDRSSCAGQTVMLDASATPTCTSATHEYRWLDGGTEVCGWSPASRCDVAPLVTTTYTVEVRCADNPGCVGSDMVTIDVVPDAVPGDLGNTFFAVKWGTDVEMTWGTDTLAVTYALYRGVAKEVWPATAARTGLPLPEAREPDVPPVPEPLYFYRAVGASCSGREGP